MYNIVAKKLRGKSRRGWVQFINMQLPLCETKRVADKLVREVMSLAAGDDDDNTAGKRVSELLDAMFDLACQADDEGSDIVLNLLMRCFEDCIETAARSGNTSVLAEQLKDPERVHYVHKAMEHAEFHGSLKAVMFLEGLGATRRSERTNLSLEASRVVLSGMCMAIVCLTSAYCSA